MLKIINPDGDLVATITGRDIKPDITKEEGKTIWDWLETGIPDPQPKFDGAAEIVETVRTVTRESWDEFWLAFLEACDERDWLVADAADLAGAV